MGTTSPVESITIGVPVPDVERAAGWYRDLLGATARIDPAPGVVEFELLPGCWLQLLRSRVGVTAGGILRLGVADVRAAHARVRDLGGQTSPIELVPGAVEYFEFRDPYGNRLSFYQML